MLLPFNSLQGSSAGKVSVLPCKRLQFDSWVQKIPCRRDRLPTPVFLECRRYQFDSWVGMILFGRDRLPTTVFFVFPGGSSGKESTCKVGVLGSIPGLGRSPGGGHGNPLYYSGLENSHGLRSLVGYCLFMELQSRTQLEQLSTAHTYSI